MNNKTIIILTEVNSDKTPYTSYVHSHAVALSNLGYKVIVLASVTIKPKVNYKKYNKSKIIDGVEVIYFKRLGVSNLLYNSKINLNAIFYYLGISKIFKRIVKKENVILIDAHTFKIQGYVAAILHKKYKIKTYVTLHGTSFNRNLKTKNGINQIRKVGKNIDSYICVSNKIFNQLEKLNIENKKIIYNGITPLKIKRNNDNFNICTGGSLIDIKNIDVVIKSFSNISKKYPEANLTIFGEGPKKEELINLVKSLKLENKVKFVGYVDNKKVYDLLSNTNIFCLLSKPEGFGIVYVEAMYSGCLTIGTKNEGIDGFIKNNENGFLINISENELTEKIDYIFNNNCNIIRENGIKLAETNIWKENAIKYVE